MIDGPRRAAEPTRDPQSHAVIGAAIEVHRHLGAGLLEGIYRDALAEELRRRAIPVSTELRLPVHYKGVRIAHPLRMDLVAFGALIIEVKAVATLLSVHHAQLATYLRLSGLPTGLLINFQCTRVVDGIYRMDRHALRPLPL
jgi:GxxExxY protein